MPVQCSLASSTALYVLHGSRQSGPSSMASEATDGDFRTCPGCSNAINIYSSKEVYLIRLSEYWHEGCFSCKLCNAPISDCRYYCFEDYICHMSCYDKQNAPDHAIHKPKDHIICRVCQGLNKMLKWTLGSCKKVERQLHHFGETGQPHETVASVADPIASASQPESTSSDVDTMPTIQAGTIASPQQSPLASKAVNELQASVGANCSSQEQNLLEEEPTKAQICSSSSPIKDICAATNTMCSNEVQGRVETNGSSREQNLPGENSKKAQITCSSSPSSSTANSNPSLDRCVVNSDLTSIFNAITSKYGDISQHCTLSSAAFKPAFWETICSIVKTLQVTRVSDLKDYQMIDMFNSLDEIKKVGFDVEWLLCHLQKIKNITELRNARIALQRLEEKQQEIANLLKRSIALKEEELLKLKSQMEEATVKCLKISHEIAVSEAGLEQTHMNTLVDGLL